MKLPAGIPTAKDMPPIVSVMVRLMPRQIVEAMRAGLQAQRPIITLRDYAIRQYDLEFDTACNATMRLHFGNESESLYKTTRDYDTIRVLCSQDACELVMFSSTGPEKTVPVEEIDLYLWDGPSARNPVL